MPSARSRKKKKILERKINEDFFAIQHWGASFEDSLWEIFFLIRNLWNVCCCLKNQKASKNAWDMKKWKKIASSPNLSPLIWQFKSFQKFQRAEAFRRRENTLILTLTGIITRILSLLFLFLCFFSPKTKKKIFHVFLLRLEIVGFVVGYSWSFQLNNACEMFLWRFINDWCLKLKKFFLKIAVQIQVLRFWRRNVVNF